MGRSRSLIIAALLSVVAAGCAPAGPATSVQQSGTAPVSTSSPPARERRLPERPASSHDLSADEAMGGHTLERHIGRTDAQLIDRLEREPHISSASTYTDRATAESVVGAALNLDNRAFGAWREREGRRPNFVLHYRADVVIGRSVRRGQSESEPCDRALVVLRWDERSQRFFVLTSYPEEGR
jgi:hypothetical protein